jgi:hypothetical protein
MPSLINKDTIHFVGGLGARVGAANVGGGCVANSFTGNLNDYMDASGGPLVSASNIQATDNGSGKVRLSPSIYGQELAEQGGFNTSSPWITDGVEIADGVATNTVLSGSLKQTIASLKPNTLYEFSFEIKNSLSGRTLAWKLGDVGNFLNPATIGIKTFQITTPPVFIYRGMEFYFSGDTGLVIDNVSVREVYGYTYPFEPVTTGTLVRVDSPLVYLSGIYEIIDSDEDYIDIDLNYIQDASSISIDIGGAFLSTELVYANNSTIPLAVDGNTYSRLLLMYRPILHSPLDDPFTQVYNGLWNLLESNDDLAALVKIGNRIKCTADKDGKEKYANADFPELIIRPAAGTSEIKSTSTHVQITQTYSVLCTAGDFRADKSFFPVKWALLNALTDGTNNLNLNFVRHVILEDSTDNRNTERFPGWNTAFNIKVEMWFKINIGD